MRQEHWEERLVHYQYIEDLLEGQRVLEVGCGSGAGAHYLARRALQVISIDPSAAALDNSRYAYSQPNLTFMRTEPANFQLKDNSFDMVLVPELKRFSTWGAFMPEVRRVLKPGGRALFAVANGDQGTEGMALAEFEEYLNDTFPNIRLMGEIPFSGVTVADFNPDGEVSPLLDCSLVPEDEPPITYVALCSAGPMDSLGYGVLQVPGGEADDGELARVRADLAEARKQLEQRRPDPRRRRGGQSQQSQQDPRRVTDLEARVEREAGRADDLERRLQAERERSDQQRDRAEEAARQTLEERGRAEAERVRAEATERALVEWQQAAGQHSKRAEAAERRCDSLLMRIEQGSADLSRLHQRIAELQGLRQADQWRVDELVGRLREQEEKMAAADTGGRRETMVLQTIDDTRELELVKELDDEKEQVEALKKEILALREHEDSAVGELQKRLSEARERARDAEMKLADAKERLDQAAEQAKEVDGQVEPMQQQLDEARAEMANLEKELMKSESRVTEHQRKHTNSEARVVQLEVRLKRTESEAATLSKWAEELRDELDASRGKSRAVPATPEPEVMALRSDLRQATARVEQLEQRCATLMAEVEAASTAAATHEQALAEVRAEADRAAAAETEKARQAREMEAELAAVRADLRNARAELDLARQDRAAERAVEPDEEQAQSDELLEVRERQIEALLEGAAIHREEADQLQLRLEEMEALVEELQHELETLQARLATGQQQQQDAVSARQDMARTNRRISTELARAQGELKRVRFETGARPPMQAPAAPTPEPVVADPTPEPAVEPPAEEQVEGEQLLEAADRALGALDRELAEVDAVNEAADSIGSRLQAEVDRLSNIERELEQLSVIKGPADED